MKSMRYAVLISLSLVVTSGSITASRGFTVAGDKQSALLNVAEIAEGLRLGQ